MENLPVYISITFILTTFITVFLFYKAANYSKAFIIIMGSWLALQTVIGVTGFYTTTDQMPPRFLVLVLPPMMLIIVLLITRRGRHFIDQLDLKTLTLLHVIRVPVELVLFWLFSYKTIPQLMTFEGRNFDILSGITAALVFYFFFNKKWIGRKVLLTWNIICLALLVNIVKDAVLSAPFSFQKFAFDQPNVAILYFPFIWLPCCVVPLVLFCHLASIRQLLVIIKTGKVKSIPNTRAMQVH